MNKKLLFPILILLLPAILVIILWQAQKTQYEDQLISSFQDCLEAGYPIMESYPRQCRVGDMTFIENLDEE